MLHGRKHTTGTPKTAHAHGDSVRHGAGGHTKSGLLLFILLIAQLMVILDITAVNIALPTLGNELQLTGSDISWTITSYSLVFGSLLLFGGRAADLLGRRRMFLAGLAVFTAASFASATAGSAEALFAARAGQGLGAAILSPAALAIIMSAFQGKRRAKALAAWAAVGGAGAAIGVLVGGVLTELADWRMIFYVNLPIAAVLAIAALKVVPADTRKPRWNGLDRSSLPSRRRRVPVGLLPRPTSSGWVASSDSPPSPFSSSAPTLRFCGSNAWRIGLSEAESS
jgi:MFS family permease